MKDHNPLFNIGGVIAVLALTFIVYYPSLFNDFVNWDDPIYVLDNPLIRDFSWDNLKAIFSTLYFNGYLPLTIFSFLMDYQLWELDPFGYHLGNLLLHLANIVLVYFFTRRLSDQETVALATALLFALHPTRVESVAWVSERKDVLYAFFFLLSLLAYDQYLKKNYRPLFYFLTTVFFILSFLSKHAGFPLPFILLLMDYYYGRPWNKRIILEKLPLIALPFLMIWLNLLMGSVLYEPHPLSERIILGCYSFVFYVFKFFFPFQLSAIYPYPEIVNGQFPQVYYLSIVGVLLLVASGAWAVYRFKKIRRWLVFGLGFFVLNIGVVLHVLVPIGGKVVVAERYTYMAYLGLFFLIAILIFGKYNGRHLMNRLPRKTIAAVLLMVIIVFGVASWQRIAVWENSISLFTDVIAKHPDAAYAYNNLGIAIDKEGDTAQAMDLYNKAITIDPELPSAYHNRGLLKLEQGAYEAAIQDFNKAVALHSGNADFFYDRGRAKYELGRYNQAMHDLNVAVSIRPRFGKALVYRGLCHFYLGNEQAAFSDINLAVQQNPTLALAYSSRGWVHFLMNNDRQAMLDLDRAIALNPDFALAYNNRGWVKLNLAAYEEAIEDFTKAVEAGPDMAIAYSNRGWARHNIGDYNGALADYQQAKAIDPSLVYPYLNSGLTMLAMDNVEDACEEFRQAAQMGHRDAEELLATHCGN